jgi:phage baseplate assembly protein W
MPDAALLWGQDLTGSPSGDIAVVSGSQLGQQRVLRRLMTNPGDYIWHADYGAGLAQFIGATCNIPQIKAAVRSQIFMESAVARTPEPVIDVRGSADGSLYVHIRYVDAPSGLSQTLSFSVSQ